VPAHDLTLGQCSRSFSPYIFVSPRAIETPLPLSPYHEVRPDCCSFCFHLLFYLPFNTARTTTTIAYANGNGNRYRYREDDGDSNNAKWGSRGASSTFSFILSVSFLCSFMCFILTDMIHTAHERARVQATPRHGLQYPPPACNPPTPASTA
jgi:hypothetical protein